MVQNFLSECKKKQKLAVKNMAFKVRIWGTILQIFILYQLKHQTVDAVKCFARTVSSVNNEPLWVQEFDGQERKFCYCLTFDITVPYKNRTVRAKGRVSWGQDENFQVGESSSNLVLPYLPGPDTCCTNVALDKNQLRDKCNRDLCNKGCVPKPEKNNIIPSLPELPPLPPGIKDQNPTLPNKKPKHVKCYNRIVSSFNNEPMYLQNNDNDNNYYCYCSVFIGNYKHDGKKISIQGRYTFGSNLQLTLGQITKPTIDYVYGGNITGGDKDCCMASTIKQIRRRCTTDLCNTDCVPARPSDPNKVPLLKPLTDPLPPNVKELVVNLPTIRPGGGDIPGMEEEEDDCTILIIIIIILIILAILCCLLYLCIFCCCCRKKEEEEPEDEPLLEETTDEDEKPLTWRRKSEIFLADQLVDEENRPRMGEKGRARLQAARRKSRIYMEDQFVDEEGRIEPDLDASPEHSLDES